MELAGLLGMTFGRLTVIDGPYYFNGSGNRSDHKHWTCRCVCGKIKYRVDHFNLVYGKSLSCGCLRDERLREKLTKHGESSPATRTAEWSIWSGMKDRCYNQNERAYGNYGGRGITVCERWLNSYPNFLFDMGRRPSDKYSLERIDVNGNYEPRNCCWATDKDQARNRRNNVFLEYRGETLCIAEWAERLGIKERIIRSRIRYGWSVDRTFNEPIGLRPKVSLTDKTYLLERRAYLETQIKRIDEILARTVPLTAS